MEKTKIIRIRLDLNGEDAKLFSDLLRQRGLTQNTQLVKQLLTEAYKKELGWTPNG